MGRYPQMRRRSLTAGALADAVGADRDAAESGGTAGEARVSPTAPPVSSPCTSGSRDGNDRTARSHRRGDGRRTVGGMRATLKPTPGRTSRRAKRGTQERADARESPRPG